MIFVSSSESCSITIAMHGGTYNAKGLPGDGGRIVMTSEMMSPLFRLAIASGRVETVRSHLERGANVNSRDNSGLPALLVAASRGRQEICEVLLEHGADSSATDGAGRTISDYATQWGFVDFPVGVEKTQPEPEPEPEPEPNQISADGALSGAFGDIAVTISVEGPLSISVQNGWGPDDALDGWEAEREFAAPVEDRDRVVVAEATHSEFSRATAVIDAASWTSVSAVLPRSLAEESTRLPNPIEAMLSEGIATGRLSVSRVREALRSVKANGAYATALGAVMSDLAINVEFSLFEDLMAMEAPAAPLVIQYTDLLAEAAELLDIIVGRDAEAEYVAEVRALRENAVTIQPILWARAEELRRRVAAVFAGMPGGIDFLEAAGASFLQTDDAATLVDENSEEEAAGDDDVYFPVQLPTENVNLEEHLSSIFAEMSDLGVAEHLMAMRLPLNVLEKATSLAIASSAPQADELAEMLGELSRRFDHIVETNLSLVPWLANRYRNRGLDYLDLVQEGSIGLIRAVQRFDPSRGASLATYAIWWIRQSITRAIADLGRSIRLPVHVQDRARKLQRLSVTLRTELGGTPSRQEVTDKMEMSAEALLRLELNVGQLMPATGDNVDRLDAKETAEIPDLDPNPEDAVAALELKRALAELLGGVEPRHARVVRLRFGLDGLEEHTLEEVGTMYSVTRERIRQIEAKALKLIGHPARSKQLRIFLDE